MSKYTTLLRWIIEQELDNRGLRHEENNWKYIYNKIGLADYPIFNENYREELNNKIIRRYYFREIGLETAELFRWYMRREMFEIMPYYNQLYESEILAKNLEPLLSFHEWTDSQRNLDHTSNDIYDEDTTLKSKFDGDIHNEHEDELNRQFHNSHEDETKSILKNEHEDETNTHHENVFSDTPMNMLHDDDEPNPIASAKWATTVSYDNTNTITDGTYKNDENVKNEGSYVNTENVITDGTYRTQTDNLTNSNGTVDSTRDIKANDDEEMHKESKGFRESQAKLLNEYRSTFLNIDLDIVNSLKDLFFGLW